MGKKGHEKRINPTFTDEVYQQIKIMAAKKHITMSQYVRECVLNSLNADVTNDNLDFIVSIIREQLNIILNKNMDRLASLESKTCVMAATAAYLNAETINRFVPETERLDLQEAYDMARKKAVRYVQGKTDS